MRVSGYRKGRFEQSANVELWNGDRLHVRVTPDKVEILKLRFGHIPLGTVWAAIGPKQVGRLIYASRAGTRLDALLEFLQDCSCIADIPSKLPNVADA